MDKIGKSWKVYNMKQPGRSTKYGMKQQERNKIYNVKQSGQKKIHHETVGRN